MIVTLLTDYGSEDEFAGVCHGVIERIAPGVPRLDITHGIPRHDVRRGALVLKNSLAYMPVGVHVAVVDPQVGTERRAAAVRCGDGRLLVGPDNGLLSLAWEACGGVSESIDVSRSPHRLEPLSEQQLEALENVDYITFTSASTVRFFVEAAQAGLAERGSLPEGPPEPFPPRARVVTIGPVTSETARTYGLPVHREAERHDLDGLVNALVQDAAG